MCLSCEGTGPHFPVSPPPTCFLYLLHFPMSSNISRGVARHNKNMRTTWHTVLGRSVECCFFPVQPLRNFQIGISKACDLLRFYTKYRVEVTNCRLKICPWICFFYIKRMRTLRNGRYVCWLVFMSYSQCFFLTSMNSVNSLSKRRVWTVNRVPSYLRTIFCCRIGLPFRANQRGPYSIQKISSDSRDAAISIQDYVPINETDKHCRQQLDVKLLLSIYMVDILSTSQNVKQINNKANIFQESICVYRLFRLYK